MTNKEFLSQAFYLNRIIRAKEKRLDWLREIVPGPTLKFSEEARVPGNPKNSAVENAALRVVELEEEIADDILHLVETVQKIGRVIGQVGSIEHRTILEMRYLGFMGWDEISARLGYSSNHVFYLHRQALNMVRI